MKALSLRLIKIYQSNAPKTLRASCRFNPSCSNYAIEAIEKYGFLKGWAKSFNRILKCRYPNGGVDQP